MLKRKNEEEKTPMDLATNNTAIQQLLCVAEPKKENEEQKKTEVNELIQRLNEE
jgi:hypothetical protein